MAPSPEELSGAIPAETPLVIQPLGWPSSPAKTGDGLFTTLLDFQAINAGNATIEIEGADLRDPERNGAIVASFSKEALAESFSGTESFFTRKTVSLKPGESGVLCLQVKFKDEKEIPRSLQLCVDLRAKRFLDASERIYEKLGLVFIPKLKPLELGAPLEGGSWIVLDSLGNSVSRKTLAPVNGRLQVPERFSMRFVGVDDARRLESEGLPKAAVLAVDDGEVVDVKDGEPDAPGAMQADKTSFEKRPGNYVVLKISKHSYAIYEHLKKGSAQVKAGQKVSKGQALAEVGASGCCEIPTLAFQLSDNPRKFAGNSLPFVFESFKLEGAVKQWRGLEQEMKKPLAPLTVLPVETPERKLELPSELQIVDFGEASK